MARLAASNQKLLEQPDSNFFELTYDNQPYFMPDINNPHYESVPGRLREFRKHLGLSQEEFGKLLDLDQTAISGMEVGRQDPTLKTIYTLIGVDCNPTWLLLADGPMLFSNLKQDAASLMVRTKGDVTEYVVRVKATKG
jgi:DNA-binding XRE family transcriptional regulator